ncbi:MAG: ribonuclease P protein component 1 [Halobacteriota archaeon]
MTLSPETLPGHELIGLRVRVATSTDPTRVGIEGRVVDETKHTLLIERDSGEVRVPKAGTTFEFVITDEAAASAKGAGTVAQPAVSAGSAGEATASVTVDGSRLLSRPARRTVSGGRLQWR